MPEAEKQKKITQAEYIDGRVSIWSIRSEANWVGIRKIFRGWEEHARQNAGVFPDGSISDLHDKRWWENKEFYWGWESDVIEYGDDTTCVCTWCRKVFITKYKERDTSNCCSEQSCQNSSKEAQVESAKMHRESVKMHREYVKIYSAYLSLSRFQQWRFRRKLDNISKRDMCRIIDSITSENVSYISVVKRLDETYRKGRDITEWFE